MFFKTASRRLSCPLSSGRLGVAKIEMRLEPGCSVN